MTADASNTGSHPIPNTGSHPIPNTGSSPTAAGRAPVVVAGWIGSTNLGDELVYTALRQQLAARGADAVAISTDPAATAAAHGTAAIPHADPRAWWRALGGAAGLVFGGGALLQDETSRWNVPYHLSRVATARARRARVVAVGLDGGRLYATSRLAVRAVLAGVPIGARDAATVADLRALGLDARLTADLALSLPAPEVAPRDEVVVSLRPRNVSSGWRPASGSWRQGLPDEQQLRSVAAALADLARGLGCTLRFVAFQADRDGVLHDQLADRVEGVEVVTVRPGVTDVLDEVARGRLVVAMRYHAAIAGLLAGRPVLASAYSRKVAALALDAPRTIRRLDVPLSRIGVADAGELLAVGDDVRRDERNVLVARERGNGQLLDDLLFRA